MNNDKASKTERLKGWFGWTLFGFIADIVGIYGAFAAQPTVAASSNSNTAISQPKVFDVFAQSDVVIATLFLTMFVVTSTLYFSYQEAKSKNEAWPVIVGFFASAGLIAVYLRLWIGEDWWQLALFCMFVPIAFILWIIWAIMFDGTTQQTNPSISQSKPSPKLKAISESVNSVPRIDKPKENPILGRGERNVANKPVSSKVENQPDKKSLWQWFLQVDQILKGDSQETD